MASYFTKIRAFLTRSSSRSPNEVCDPFRPVEVTARRDSSIQQAEHETCYAGELSEAEICKLVSFFRMSEVQHDLVARYMRGEFGPIVPTKSYGMAQDEVNQRFESMVRDCSEGSFQIHISANGTSQHRPGDQAVNWTISRADWKIWRCNTICRALIKLYIQSGLTLMDAEVRAILFYLRCLGSTLGPAQPPSKATSDHSRSPSHSHFRSLRDRWWLWRWSSSTHIEDHIDAMILDEAQTQDRAMIPDGILPDRP